MNILIVAVDTLRAAQLSCYGYPRPTSPTMDQLAREGVLFEDMVCSGIPTHPSFTTLYTGQHPMTHGIVAHDGQVSLSRKTPVLPQVLLKRGWTTCAVDNLASARGWFQSGYEFYIDPSRRRALGLSVTCEEQNARAIEFLRRYGDERFFMFVHYWDPHTPYLPPEPYRTMFYDGDMRTATDPTNRGLDALWRHPLGEMWRDTWFRSLGGVTDPDFVRALYDGSVRYVDTAIGALLTTLDEIGHRNDTLVVLMGDHGECLGEHGVWYDHHGLYEENLRVPFILRYPDGIPADVRISDTVRTMDIAPTILDLAGVPIPESMEGRSLKPLLVESGAGESALAPLDRVFACECMWQAKWALRTPDYKLIVARSIDFYGLPRRELYDRRADPYETVNLAESKPEIADALERQLEEWIASEVARLGLPGDPVIEQGRERFAKRWSGTKE